MRRTAATLTTLTAVLALGAAATMAGAASCSGSLPGSNAVPGWQTMAGGTLSGSMGSKASFDAYDGAVETMRDAQGIRFFAQRVFKRAKPKGYLTVDVYQFASVAQAQAFYARSKADYRLAKLLTSFSGVKDQAFAGALGGAAAGFCRRGKYLCQVSISGGATAQDIQTAKAFVAYVSRKLGS